MANHTTTKAYKVLNSDLIEAYVFASLADVETKTNRVRVGIRLSGVAAWAELGHVTLVDTQGSDELKIVDIDFDTFSALLAGLRPAARTL